MLVSLNMTFCLFVFFFAFTRKRCLLGKAVTCIFSRLAKVVYGRKARGGSGMLWIRIWSDPERLGSRSEIIFLIQTFKIT